VPTLREGNYSQSLTEYSTLNDMDSNPSTSFSSSCEFRQQNLDSVSTNTEFGSLNSFQDFYSQFFSEQLPCANEKTAGVIKEFRNLFLENYLQRNNVGRKSKSNVKGKSETKFILFNEIPKCIQYLFKLKFPKD